MVVMVLVETPVFTRLVNRYLDDDQYRALQAVLSDNPDAGDVIPGSGGLWKLRWRLASRGKRGGLRVIYYRVVSAEQIYLLYVYAKNEQTDLTRDQLRTLRQVVDRW